MTPPRRPPGWWDRIQKSRHRRSILGSLAVLVLLVVVVIAGLFQDGGTRPGDASTPTTVTSVGVSHRAVDTLPGQLRH